MTHEVVVTRRGQTTIPAAIRKTIGIKEGARLKVEIEGEKVVFTKIPSLFDLAGTSKLSQEEAFRLLDEMREEEQCSLTLAISGLYSLGRIQDT